MLDYAETLAEPEVLREPSITDLLDIARLAPGQSVFLENCAPIPFRWQVMSDFDLSREIRGDVRGLTVKRVTHPKAGVKVARVA